MGLECVLKLSEEERVELSEIARGVRGRRPITQWKVTRAKALLKCDEGKRGRAGRMRGSRRLLDVTTRSVENWRKKPVFEGSEAAMTRAPGRTVGLWICRTRRLRCRSV